MAVAFGLAPFILVTTVATFYVRLQATWELRALFHGIAPVVVVLIVRACWNLGRKTLRRDVKAWIFFAVACAITAILQREIAVLFVVTGVLGAFVFALPDTKAVVTPPRPNVTARMVAFVPVLGGATGKLFVFFFKTGFLVFGSGLVIVPFLKTQVVDHYHWLTDHQFLDAVAIGMISPGPVVITATFVGFVVGGFSGGLAATLGIFSPSVLFVLCATPLLLRYRHNGRLRGFIRGVATTVVGVLAGTTWLIARTAIADSLAIVVALASFAALVRWPKVPEPIIIAAAGAAGLLTDLLLR